MKRVKTKKMRRRRRETETCGRHLLLNDQSTRAKAVATLSAKHRWAVLAPPRALVLSAKPLALRALAKFCAFPPSAPIAFFLANHRLHEDDHDGDDSPS